MRRRAVAYGATAAAMVGCASSGVPASAETQDGLRSLIAAERAFARRSESSGMKEAFVANLGSDGLLFRPGPVNGLAWIRDRPAASGYLSWEPDWAEVSVSNDLGYTTGPYEFRARGASDTVSGAGHYVSVWRRDTTDAWKIALDIGTSHHLVPRPADAGGRMGSIAAALGDGAQQRLHARDSALGVGGAPQRTALVDAMAADARFHRDGALPALGTVAARAALRGDDRPYHSKALGGGASRAGDFGYTYGDYQLLPSFTHQAERGFYLRIWRSGDDGTWRIILDLAQPVRPPG